MNIKVINGNIFNSQAQTLVNTVNCVGAMGKGLALEFRLRYPELYQKYVQLCEQNLMQIGKLWIYKADDHWILNFPTKEHWRYNSKIEYLEKGLDKFMQSYQAKGIISIAFPLLGSRNGNIPPETSLHVMKTYLPKCQIPVEIYIDNQNQADQYFLNFKKFLFNLRDDEIKKIWRTSAAKMQTFKETLSNPEIVSFSQLLSTKTIGIRAIEKALKMYQSGIN